MFSVRLKLLPTFVVLLGSGTIILLIEAALLMDPLLVRLPKNCDRTECILPGCLRMSTSNPKGLNPKEIPQMVFLTFDDVVNDENYHILDKILGNRVNPNGCSISMTLYVTHVWANLSRYGTNYGLVNKYFNRGNEIASHSVTHTFDFEYWKNTTIGFWEKEIGQQREIINAYSNIPLQEIQGFRAPFLQAGGDATLSALRSLGMRFDSSLKPPPKFSDPPIWPFTLDCGVTFDCEIPPCSNEKHPGLWEVPLLPFKSGENGSYCAMADTCFEDYKNLTAKEVYDYFIFNFERYKENRAPFGIYQHVWWFLDNEAILEGFLKFLDYLGTLDYVYIVTVSQGLKWIKNPANLNESDFDCFCNSLNETPCTDPQVCTYSNSVSGNAQRMGSCTFCPSEFPWLDNFESTQLSKITLTLPLLLLLLISVLLITHIIGKTRSRSYLKFCKTLEKLTIRRQLKKN